MNSAQETKIRELYYNGDFDQIKTLYLIQPKFHYLNEDFYYRYVIDEYIAKYNAHDLFNYFVKNLETYFNVKFIIHRAIHYDNYNFVKWILQNYNHAHCHLSFILENLCNKGNMEFCQWMFANYPNFSFDLNKALRFMSFTGNIKFAQFLIEQGADDLYGLFIGAYNYRCKDIIKFLVENYLDGEYTDEMINYFNENNINYKQRLSVESD